MKKILVFSQDETLKRILRRLLLSEDIEVIETSSALDAIHMVKSEKIGIILIGQTLRDSELMEFRELLKESRPGSVLLYIDGYSEESGNVTVNASDMREFMFKSLKLEKTLCSDIEIYKNSFLSFSEKIIQIIGVNNRYFYNNDRLVAELSRRIAVRMNLEEDLVHAIRLAALIKDLGKIGIQQQLLDEKKRLTNDELIPIKKHSMNTVQIFKQVQFPWDVESIVLQHHEQYDGKGYPFGLRGRQITIGARIISVADSFVAMTTDRPYRKALSRDEAVQEMVKKTGTQFDPEVMEAFMSIINEMPLDAEFKKGILLLEKQPALTALIKLSFNPDKFDVKHLESSIEAIRYVRQNPPSLIIADADVFDKSAFLKFHKTLFGMTGISDKPFIFIVPDAGYPRHFPGDKNHYIVKPVDIRELTMTISHLIDAEEAGQRKTQEIKGLSGSLEDFGLDDIVQILNIGLKTAKVELESSGKKGLLYLQNGKVIHASTGAFRGKNAFFEMIGWKKGSFRILHGFSTEDINITEDTMYLLIETARMIDERNRL